MKKDAYKLTCPGGRINVDETALYRKVVPAFAVVSAACAWAKPEIMAYADRKEGLLGLWNHGAHFDDVFTLIWDGAPFEAWGPGAWMGDGGIEAGVLTIGASELQSGKYNTTVYKGHFGIGFHGCLHADSGPHLGVDHDKRMMDDMESYFPREPGEWHLGDLGYVGAERVLYPQKRPAHDSQEPWDVDCEFWTHLIAGYRGRVENVIYKIKSHMWCQTPFRGRFESLCLYYNIAVVLTALELRSRFERTTLSRFEVVGPWRHTF